MQMYFLPYDPYGSSFRPTFRPNPPNDDGMSLFHLSKARNAHVAMHNFELDSLCYPLWLSHEWWKATGRSTIFSERWRQSVWLILDVFKREQRHFLDKTGRSKNDCSDPMTSCYRYLEMPGREHQGGEVGYTGMIWSWFRPSDDQQRYGYLVPSNIFAAVVLEDLEEICREVLQDEEMEQVARGLRMEVLQGVQKFGIVDAPDGKGRMLAYEVNGLGGVNLMDDANVPSLLSLPYFGFPKNSSLLSGDDDINDLLRNSREFVLSEKNPMFFQGKFAHGIGSPHTLPQHAWHMAIIMQGLTIDDPAKSQEELREVFEMLQRTDADTNYMHEAFDVNNPNKFSRKWFAWSNSLFAELVIKHFQWLTTNTTIEEQREQ